MLDPQSGFILICWLFGFYFFIRPAKYSPAIESPSTKISIIVPARNEEKNLIQLLSSLQNQSAAPFEVIVVNDQSTDQTAKVARDFGVTVIENFSPPQGWIGKSFACFQGAQAATGDYLLFVDADVAFELHSLVKIQSIASKIKGAASFLPWHVVLKSYESLSSIFNIVMGAGSRAFAIYNHDQRLLGQTLLISKNDYFKVGGHEVVKNRILENFYFSDVLREKQIPVATYNGKGLFRMRMFPNGAEDLVQSWMKGFVTGAAKVPIFLMLSIVLWMSGGLSIFFQILFTLIQTHRTYVESGLFVIYLLYVVQIRWMLSKIGNYSWKTAILFPYYIGFFIALFAFSLILKLTGRKAQWKGRSVG